MEDLRFVEKFFDGIIILVAFIFLFATIGAFIGVCKGNINILVLFAILATWFVTYVIIKFNRIMFTRFVAISENILEITQLLEINLKTTIGDTSDE